MAVYAQSLFLALSRYVSEQGLRDCEFVLYGDSVVLSSVFFDGMESLDALSSAVPPHSLRPAGQYFKDLNNDGRRSDERKIRFLMRTLSSRGGRHLNMVLDQFIMPFRFLYDGIDLVHSTSNVGILATPLPQVVTVHDLYQGWPPQKASSRLASLVSFVYRGIFGVQSKRAERIICDTKSIEREVVARFGYPKSRIRTVFLGIDDSFKDHWQKRHSEDAIRDARRWLSKHDLQPGYLLLTASSDPRKNLEKSLLAWKSLSPSLRSHGLLVKCVDSGAKKKCKELLGNDEDVRYLAWLEREELPLLLACARAVLLATHAEGFGLPALEAFATGTPIVSGEIEVVKTFAPKSRGHLFLCDPLDQESIAEATRRALTEGIASACASLAGEGDAGSGSEKTVVTGAASAVGVPAMGSVRPGMNGTPRPRTFAETAEETYGVYRDLSYRCSRSLA